MGGAGSTQASWTDVFLHGPFTILVSEQPAHMDMVETDTGIPSGSAAAISFILATAILEVQVYCPLS